MSRLRIHLIAHIVQNITIKSNGIYVIFIICHSHKDFSDNLFDNYIQTTFLFNQAVTFLIDDISLNVHTFCKFKRHATTGLTRTFTCILSPSHQILIFSFSQRLSGTNSLLYIVVLVSILNPIWSPVFHQVIFQRNKEFGPSRISLATRTTTNLKVNPLVHHPFGPNNY